uniref:Uncharacterized protein n=1 Tax=Lepeophtheirus salmonis TaxID=72036 RepID=A0A0K2VHI5_LEPSM
MWSLTRTHTSLLVSDHGYFPFSTRPKLRHSPYSSAFRRRRSVFSVDKKGLPNSSRASFTDDPTAGRSRDPDIILVANVES